MTDQLDFWPTPEKPKGFANYPKSVAEVRAERSSDARQWGPRDALISVLRDIDQGLSTPDVIVMFYKTTLADGSYKLSTVTAGAMRHELAGVAAEGINNIVRHGDD